MATAVMVFESQSGRIQSKKPNPVLSFRAFRLCRVCEEPISQARLQAIPNATQCVGCLTAAGDVPLVRRFDEQTGDNETVSVYGDSNTRVRTSISSLKSLKESSDDEQDTPLSCRFYESESI